MRRIALATLLVFASAPISGCNFAVKHPGVTAGTVAGTLSLAMCELNSEDHAACFGISGIVGVGLALIAGTAIWLGTEPEPAAATQAPPPVDWSKIPDTTPAPPPPPPPPPPPVPLPPASPEPAPAPGPIPATP